MIKNLKKIFIVLMFIMMATMATGKSYAEFLEENHINESNPYSGTFSLYLEDLESDKNWNMLCSEHGRRLPSRNNVNNAYTGGKNDYNEIFNTIEWLKSYSSTEETNEYVGKKYHSAEVAYYVTKQSHICTPKAAYVFNHMEEGTNSYGTPDSYTDIQKAWYNIINGGSNNSSLYKQASAYQSFVKKIAKNKKDVDNPEKYVKMSHTFEGGEKQSIKFPEIDTEKINSMISFNTVDKDNKVSKTGDNWASGVTVSYDQEAQKYKIGPFSINYIKASSEGIDFGAINGFDIYTDASNEPVSKDQWRFIWLDGHENSKYPLPNEVFYIEMDYIENATMITGMDVDYKYLIAGAQYQDLEGTYNQYNWKVKCDTTTVENEDETTTTYYHWYFKNSQKKLKRKSQKLALVDKAARWYESTKLQFRTEQEKQANLVIKKNALDENGNEMTADQVKEKFGEYQYFDFKVKVTHSSGEVENEVVTVRAGSSTIAGPYSWNGEDSAPTYEVEEITPVGNWKYESIENEKGSFESGKTVTVIAKNKIDIPPPPEEPPNNTEHKGGIKVVKDIKTSEKISKETLEKDGTKFDIEVVIDGTFIHDGRTYDNTTEVITKTLPDNGKWEFEINDVKWYGSKAPTFTVIEKNMPTGWRFKSINFSDVENESTSSEGHNLMDGKTITATVTNELPSDTLIDLTFSMGGLVWIDDTLDEKNTADDGYYSAPNGVYDDGETLKENAEVTVYRVVKDSSGNEAYRTVATAYKDANKNEVTFPIITKSDGKWNVPRISVPAVSEEEKEKGYSASYDVEFAYDGQTYEPTEFLSYKISKDGTKEKNKGSNSEKAEEYINAKTSVKDKYAKDSMALEVSNNAKKITEISGKTEMNANGDTTGIVTLADGTQSEITYSSDNAGSGYPTISKVNTTNDNGAVLDIFKARATTSAGELTFPFDVDGYDGSSLTSVNKTIDELGVHHKYKYIAVYNYCLNINLGLKERATADIGLTKKLDNAKVVVKEKMYQYNYSGNYDLTEEKVSSLDKNIKVDNADTDELKLGYTLGLYRSDYYYRAQMYKNGEDTSMYDRLEGFYKTLNKSVTDTEMDIYLTYKIKLMNNSSAYDVAINSLDDYYDSSLTLVRAEERKYLKTKTIGSNGTEETVNAEEIVANASDLSDKWTDVKTGIVGSDKDGNGNNIIYNKMTANGLGIKLGSGESKEIFVTFKVNKENNNDAKNAIKLGQKCNVAEIGSYATFDKGTNTYAGRFDRDSAPSNVNISANNTKAWYEDDTFAAPRINVNFVFENADRTISGLAWEDNSNDKNTEKPGYNQQVGNGIMDPEENTIKDLTTELVEKVMVPNADGTTYTEYDYIWPTDQKLDDLNGKTIEQVTGLDSTITTSDKGEYTFINAPAGDYVVRFTYGDKKMESANYSTAEYYNGQDYKSSKFNSILKDGDTLKADSYLNIEEISKQDLKNNTAIDNEARRLQVVANSREITYDNSSVMAEYQDELFSDYNMYAETPKLDINIELQGTATESYNINNIDFGLEERPSTQLTLDKQIEEIILTTSDGNTIMDAKYNINYDIAEDGKITANVELDTRNSYGIDNLQALNRDLATNQGFRYINVDSNILEGTTITVKYRFTVLNTGEVDRTGELANIAYINGVDEDKEHFDGLRDTLLTEFATYRKAGSTLVNNKEYGYYVGNIYYYGADRGDKADAVVTSTVRQLVDYIDNDMTFSGTLNATTDTSWSTVTPDELKLLIKDEIITSQEDGTSNVLDSDNVQYYTENRDNLVVSVDNADSSKSLNNNGFIVEIAPCAATDSNNNPAGNDEDYKSSMYLTTTRYVGSDSDDLQIDNITEIIKYNNKVGRRDQLTIAGNLVPSEALVVNQSNLERFFSDGTVSAIMSYTRDSSATEVITLSPPTGTGLNTWRLQVLAATTAGLVVIVGGIILIKKKVLK